MNYDEIILLALALAIDALVVSFSFGLVLKKHRINNALGLGVATGSGQFLMPVIGFFATSSIYHYVERWDHWIAFTVFLCLGVKIIFDALTEKNNRGKREIPNKLSFKVLTLTGVATSIDALVAGASLYLTQSHDCLETDGVGIFPASTIIGSVTFACATGGFLSTKYLHKLPTIILEITAGIVLIGLGVKILIEHTNCF